MSTSGMNNKANLKELNVLSLFSGCGGMDLGFEGGFEIHKSCFNSAVSKWEYLEKGDKVYLPKTRFKTVFANDIKPDARTAWVSFFGKRGATAEQFHLDSIVNLVKLVKQESRDIFPKNIDLVTGGFPCQDFSVAGKRLGFDSKKSHLGKSLGAEEATEENRGKLYMWMKQVIELVSPKMFIAENVKGLANLGDIQKIIEADFSNTGKAGYFVFPAKVLLAAEYGVPQSRERIIFIGLRKDALRQEVLGQLSIEVSEELNPYPLKTHSNDSSSGLAPFSKLIDIFADLAEPENSDSIDQQSYSKAKFMGRHCQGQTEVNLYGIGPTIRSEHHGNIEYRRLSVENGGKYLHELDAGLKERRLTIRECAKIQTFPDDYVFIQKSDCLGYKNVSASDAYKLIGNAVPPLLAYHLAKRIEELWDVYFE